MSSQSLLKVVLTDPQLSAICTWCEKDRECVTATFNDGFLTDAPICWRCLATSVRVRAKAIKPTKSPTRQAESSAES